MVEVDVTRIVEGDAFFPGVFDGIEFRDFFASGDDENRLIGSVGVGNRKNP